MFEFSFAELMLVAVAAIIFIGPEDMPKAFKAVMKVVRQLQGAVGEVKKGMDELVAESGLHDAKDELEYIIDMEGNRQPVYDITDMLEQPEKAPVMTSGKTHEHD